MQKRTREKRDILFVSHDATRTGAPIVLLAFLQWARENTDLTFDILLLKAGPLHEDFESMAPVHLLDDTVTGHSTLFERALRRKLGMAAVANALSRRRIRKRMRELSSYKLIYCNSIFSLEALRLLDISDPSADHKVLCHVHELDFALEDFLQYSADLLPRCDKFISVSHSVTEALVEVGIERDRVDLRYGFLRETPGAVPAEEVEIVRRELGIPEGAVIVGGSGVIEWRKGTDVFVEVARSVQQAFPGEVYFLWVGGNHHDWNYRTLRHAIKHCGIDDRVRLVESTSNPHRYFASFDVFALPSREDPFPLVCLEAAAMRKPLVCFSSSGIVEFVNKGCGLVVPHLDGEAMAARIVALLNDPALRERLGECGAALAARDHQASVIAPEILVTIKKLLTP